MTSTAKCARRQNNDPGGESHPPLSGRGNNKQFLSSLLNFWRLSDRSLTKNRNMQLGGLPVPKKRDNDSKKRRGGICFIQIRLAESMCRNGLLAILTVVVRVAWPKAVSSKICVPFFRGLSRKPIKSPFLGVRSHVKRAYNCPTAQPIH